MASFHIFVFLNDPHVLEHFLSIPAYDSTYNEPITIPLGSRVDIKLQLNYEKCGQFEGKNTQQFQVALSRTQGF